MASPPDPTTMENIPGDVLPNIFIRLLARQIAQMRCVCKSWNLLLSESSFIKSHLHHSLHNKDRISFFFQWGCSFYCRSITASPPHTPVLELNDFIKLPVIPKFKNSSGDVIGSVNGLICFYYESSSGIVVYIWNPSLSKVLTLPPCSLPYDDSLTIDFRFGFDPKTDDYKVVKVTSLFDPPKMLPEVEVYSMRKGSWDLITQRLPSHITMIRDDDRVCVDGHDGHLHWLGSTELQGNPETILAFDLGAETFCEMPLPHFIAHHHEYEFVLGVLRGKLCVTVMSCVQDRIYEVWVMEEYGVAESWVKHHAFSQYSVYIHPYGFTSDSKLLFQVNDDRFALYDPVAFNAKSFQIPSPYGVYKIVEYFDSLVWVSTAKHER